MRLRVPERMGGIMHRSRTFKVVDVSAEQLVGCLSEHTWILCTAFRCGPNLWLNDATHEDGAAEYAVFRESDMAQVESITTSWCTREQLLKYSRDPVDESDRIKTKITNRIDAPQQHGRCPLCT